MLIVTWSFNVSDGIISYTIPVDGSATDNAEIRDLSYDGVVSGDKFQGGLGRLVDGVRGGDNFKMDIGYGKGIYDPSRETVKPFGRRGGQINESIRARGHVHKLIHSDTERSVAKLADVFVVRHARPMRLDGIRFYGKSLEIPGFQMPLRNA